MDNPLDVRERVGENVHQGIFYGAKNRVSGLIALANPRRIKASHRRRWKCATGSRPYANNNPYKFTDPDGRENVLGILLRVSEYSPATPTPAQMAFTTSIVDATVNVAVQSGRQDLIGQAKNWDPVITSEAKTPQGHDADTTAGDPANGDKTFTLFSEGVMQVADANKSHNLEGIVAKGGSPAAMALGSHELYGHGSQANAAVPSGRANEADATQRTWDALKETPEVKEGAIKCATCE